MSLILAAVTDVQRNPAAEYIEAVDVLCRPHLVDITGPDGERIGTRLEAPMLQTLASNVASGTSRGGGTGEQPHARLPLNVGAADLLGSIRTAVLAAYATLPHGTARPDVIPALLEVRLAMLNDHRAGAITTRDLDRATGQLTRWARGIRDLLDPPMRLELTDPCPRCGERWVVSPNPDVDSRPALSTTYRDPAHPFTECAYCGAGWAGVDGARRLRSEMDASERMRHLLLGVVA